MYIGPLQMAKFMCRKLLAITSLLLLITDLVGHLLHLMGLVSEMLDWVNQSLPCILTIFEKLNEKLMNK